MKFTKIYSLMLLVLYLFGASAAHATTSVSATGVVHSVWTTMGVTHLKIEEPDGNKVAAACNANIFTTEECAIATVGEAAWGRATCSGGVCTWTCLDVENQCLSNGQLFTFNGTVLSKESCTGILYLTMLSNGTELTAQCDNYEECQDVDIDQPIAGSMLFKCGETNWLSISPD